MDRGPPVASQGPTDSDGFDFAHKLVRTKEPQEFARIQTEFFSRQAQVLAGSGQRIMQDVNDVAKTTLEGAAESSRRRSEAA